MKILENVKLNFSPTYEVTESKEGSWLNMGGIALTEGKSKNGVNYNFQNLTENNGKPFKWLFGHPHNPEEHIVGHGKLVLEGNMLRHEGRIRNTSTHPDVVESVRDGFLGPSIHATAGKIKMNEEDGSVDVEGLSIDGVGLVAFQGVEQASIEYAIAESFDLNDKKEIKETKEDDTMSEETPKDEVQTPEEPKEEAKQESVTETSDEIKKLQEELKELKESQKQEIVGKIVELNKDFDKEKLVEKSKRELETILEYEKKLSESTNEASQVHEEEEEPEKEEEVVEEKDGSVRLSETSYRKFNEEIKEKVM